MSAATLKLCLAALLLSLLAIPAVADENDGLAVSVRFGYAGIVAAEHWSPVRVILTSPSEPIAGTITLDYIQDGSQSASVTTAFSLAPAVATPIDIDVCFPPYVASVGLHIRSDSGKRLLDAKLSFRGPNRSSVAFTPPTIVSDPTAILAIGLPELAPIGEIWSGVWLPIGNGPTQDEAANGAIETRRRLTTLQPDDLFSSWTAYDGVDAVLVRASIISSLPERARRALLAWQSAGGSLVIIVDDESNLWRQWLPESDASLTLAESASLSLPAELASLANHARKAGFKDSALAQSADTIVARPITITDFEAGWKPLYPVDSRPGTCLAVRGPVGLGTVTLIAFNPARVAAIPSDTARAIAWGATLDHLLAEAPDEIDSQGAFFVAGSGSHGTQIDAIRTLLDSCLSAKLVQPRILILILTVLAFFAIAIGPLDWFILGRFKLRHWSWLSAIAWIALASILASRTPGLINRQKSRVGRVAITDARLDATGRPAASWTTALSATYAGSAAQLTPLDDRPGAAWRGVSPLPIWFYSSSPRPSALSALRLFQRPEAGPQGARSTLTPVNLTQGVWTARGLLDIAPAPPVITARLARDDTGLTLQLGPAPPNVMISSAAVRFQNKLWRLRNPQPGTLTSLAFADATPESQTPTSVATLLAQPNNLDRLALLPGPAERGPAIAMLLSSPRYALIELSYHADVSTIPYRGADHSAERGAVRLIVPVPDGALTP